MKQTFCFGLTQVDNRGRNFLHTAIQKSDIESVLFLISVHANVNSRTQDQHHLTPLHLAVMAGSEIIVRNLVSPASACCSSVCVCLSLYVCVCRSVGLSLSVSLHSSLPPSVLTLAHSVSLSLCLLPSSSPLSPPSLLIVAFSLSHIPHLCTPPPPPPPFCLACLCSAICILAQPPPPPPPLPHPSALSLYQSVCMSVPLSPIIHSWYDLFLSSPFPLTQ